MTGHIVTREIRDNKTRKLARMYLSRAVTTRWMPGALTLGRSSCHRCSSNCGNETPTGLLVPGIGMGEERKESRRVNDNEEIYCTRGVYSPHALNSEQRLRRAGRFSPTATWPLPPLSQLERERRSQSLHTPSRVPTKYIN